METNNTAVITTATNENILTEIKRLGTSKAAVAHNAGIAMTTFDRKMKRHDFTIRELGAIAEALNLTLADIFPVALLAKDAA